MKRHFSELKAMVSSINTETQGAKLLLDRSEPIHGEIGFSYKYRIGRGDEILLDWSNFGEAHGFLKAMILSLDIQGDILISREDSENTIEWAVKNSTKNLQERVKSLLDMIQKKDEVLDNNNKQEHLYIYKIRELNELIHNLRAELAVKGMTVKDLQRKIGTLEEEAYGNDGVIANLKRELLSDRLNEGEISVPTRATIMAELKLAWDTNGQTSLFHTWCLSLVSEIIKKKIAPHHPEDIFLFLEYASASHDATENFINMIGTKYARTIQSMLIRQEEDSLAPPLMKI